MYGGAKSPAYFPFLHKTKLSAASHDHQGGTCAFGERFVGRVKVMAGAVVRSREGRGWEEFGGWAMESANQMAVNSRLMLCSVAGVIGLFFLVFCVDRGWRQGLLAVEFVEMKEGPGYSAVAAEGAVPAVNTSEQIPLKYSTSVAGYRATATEGATPAVNTSEGMLSKYSPPTLTESVPLTTLQLGAGQVIEPQSSFELFPISIEQPVIDPPPPQLSPAQAAYHLNSAAQENVSVPPPGDALPPKSSDQPLSLQVSAAGGEQQLAGEKECNIFEGKWIYDPKAYPLYRGRRCPFLSDQVSCQRNGRPDSDYEHWRWQPSGCDIPRFDGRSVLERLRGKRVVIVGDSINRNMWESLTCLLYSSVRPSRAIVKAQASDHKIFRALDYECTVEFFWSPFLVWLEVTSDGKKVIRLDKLPPSSWRWKNADVIVFNTGHWWTHSGKFRSWDFFGQKGELVEDMDVTLAFQTALGTWSRWMNKKVDPAKTRVFFRSVSPEHKRENLHWCYNQTYPITNETYVQWFPRSMMEAVEKTVANMRTPVGYLNITRLSEFRREAHTSVYTVRQMKLLTEEQRRQPSKYADCSHWCLPGLPDTWNVLLLASIFNN